MDALRLILRAELRRRWRPMLGLALLLGVTGGVVLAAAAGAERTATAYPRLLRWAAASQLDLVSDQHSPAAFYHQLRALPQVAAMSLASYYDAVLPAHRGQAPAPVAAWSSPDGSMGVTMDRVKILAGQRFSRADPRAAMIDSQLAAREHLRPGGILRLLVVPHSATGSAEPQRAVPMSFRVTAIAVFDHQIVPVNQADAEPAALLSPAFTRTTAARAASFGNQAAVRLRPGAARPPFVRAATALARRYPGTQGLYVVDLTARTAAAQQAIRPQVVALAAFAALIALISLAVLGQLLARQLVLDSADFPVLRVLGTTRPGRMAISLARLACVSVAGSILAVAGAVAASPLMPIGSARLAEPAPGVDVNVAVLGAGACLIALLPLLLLAPAAWRVAGQPAPGDQDTRPPEKARTQRLARALPVTAGIGVRMALDPGRGRTAVPVRSALSGMIVAVAAVITAAVFGASFLHLIATPRMYGQNWQQELDLGFGGIRPAFAARLMAAQPGLAGDAAGNYGQLNVAGQVVPAIGIDQVRGRGYLTLLAGRAPAAPGEIALGQQTLRDIHGRLGQRVRVVINGRPRLMHVVGVAVLAGFGQGTVIATDLGSGAVVRAPVLSVPAPQSGCPAGNTCYNFMLARFRAGTSAGAATARLNATIARLCPPEACAVTTDQRPGEIRHYSSVRDTPLLLGLVLAVLAVGTLSHVLLTSVRRRRRDLAVLKALGLARAQVLAVIAWQAAAVAVTAVAIGVPLGLLAGRWAWVVFADAAGVAPGATIPVPLVLLAVPATVALSVLIAAWPGRAAARVRPAVALRAE